MPNEDSQRGWSGDDEKLYPTVHSNDVQTAFVWPWPSPQLPLKAPRKNFPKLKLHRAEQELELGTSNHYWITTAPRLQRFNAYKLFLPASC